MVALGSVQSNELETSSNRSVQHLSLIPLYRAHRSFSLTDDALGSSTVGKGYVVSKTLICFVLHWQEYNQEEDREEGRDQHPAVPLALQIIHYLQSLQHVDQLMYHHSKSKHHTWCTHCMDVSKLFEMFQPTGIE